MIRAGHGDAETQILSQQIKTHIWWEIVVICEYTSFLGAQAPMQHYIQILQYNKLISDMET